MRREYRLPKHLLENCLFIRPDCRGAFLQPGMKGKANSEASMIALMAAGPKLIVKEESYRDHFLN